MSTLAENLKFLRRRENLTQTKFGEALGLNRGNIDSYEKGTEPRLKVLVQIARKYKLNLMQLITSKMTQDNYHLFAEDIEPGFAEDPAAMYGDSEVYTLLRDIEDAEDIDDRRKISKEVMKKVGRIMTENSTLRKELMDELRKRPKG